MSGYLLLEGGAEFGGGMAHPDRAAIEAAGGPTAPIAVIPAAAAPDNNAQRAAENAQRWFRRLGALQIECLPLVDRVSAEDPVIADHLKHSRLIYLLGGFPAHLAKSLEASRSWRAIRQAYRSGAVIAGSSAGAMVLCSDYFDPHTDTIQSGLGLLARTCFIPHHDTFGRDWVPALRKKLPTHLLLGIDEQTGALCRSPLDEWRVYGNGCVTLYGQKRTTAVGPGHSFQLVDAHGYSPGDPNTSQSH